MNTWLKRIPVRKVIQSLLLTAIMAGAFRLSFDAQQTLATASGIDPGIAWIYPLIIDGAILTGVLVDIWTPNLSRGLLRWLYIAVAFWSITNILGNAIHVLALPPERVTVPLGLALAVNTIPGVTLFLVIHLSRILLVGPPPTKTKKPPASAFPTATPAALRQPRINDRINDRSDISPLTDEQLLALLDKRVSYSQIATQTGRSKSWVGTQALRVLADRAQRQEITA